MDAEHHDLLPQWRPRPATTQGQPRGLLDELAEEGVLTKDLIVPGAVYRVTTRIHSDPQACSFRCSVSANGVELQEPPWQPSFRNLGAESGTGGPEGRKELARVALESHLATCARVGEALERHGRLASAGGGKQWLVPAVAVVALLAFAAAGTWWFLRPPDATTTSAPKAMEGVEAQPGELGEGPVSDGSEELLPAEGPGIAEVPAAVPGPGPEPSGESLEGRASSKHTEAPAGAAARRAASGSGSRRDTPAVPARAADSLAAPERVEPAEPSPEPLRRASGSGLAPAALEVSPADHSVLILENGGQIYAGDGVRLIDVPPAFRGLRCITTRESVGDTPQGVVLTLAEPARLLVLFDQQVGRRPDWLASFRQTGEVVIAADPERAREPYTFLVFAKEVPAGIVSLGTNTAARGFTKKARVLSRKNTLMYLVCPAAPVPGG